jgi:molecular chaperone GrpE
MCGERGRVTGMTDNTDTLEMVVHFLEVLVQMNDDNVPASLETRSMIPIISEVSEMNTKKRGEIHE